MCTVEGGVTEKLQKKVSILFAIFPNLTSTQQVSLVNLKPQEKKKIVNIYVPLVCSLPILNLILVSKSLFTDNYVTACFGLHCLPVLLNADTILHWLVQRRGQIHSDDNPQENGLHGDRPPEALCKPQGSVLQQWAVSLEQVSRNRIITTNTYNEWKEHSCSSMLPLISATSVYIYHTLKKKKTNLTI